MKLYRFVDKQIKTLNWRMKCPLKSRQMWLWPFKNELWHFFRSFRTRTGRFRCSSSGCSSFFLAFITWGSPSTPPKVTAVIPTTISRILTTDPDPCLVGVTQAAWRYLWYFTSCVWAEVRDEVTSHPARYISYAKIYSSLKYTLICKIAKRNAFVCLFYVWCDVYIDIRKYCFK